MIRYAEKVGRAVSLRRCVPELLTAGERSVLYVGARASRTEFAAELAAAGAVIDVLEVWEQNVNDLRAAAPPWLRHVFHHDVRNVDLLPLPHYDVVFWWHGPEHVTRLEAQRTAMKLRRIADLVVLGCPWGDYPQGALGGNPHEEHVWAPEPEEFEALGFDVEVLPPKGRGGNILSWWRHPRSTQS